MPLDVAIIGAGIAGLTAAVSLSRSGHRVQIYEASAFSGEIGAAVSLAPNGVQVLQHLGFDFQRARAVKMVSWDTVNGVDLARIACQDLNGAADKLGAPFFAIHRVDLHRELMRLANVSEVRGPVTGQQVDGIILRLASPVTRVGAQEGRIEFADGTVRHADLIVGANGLRSVVRNAVAHGPGLAESIRLVSTGQSAFRFLVPTEDLRATVSGRKLLEWKTLGACLLADTKLVDKERHIMWYPCREDAKDIKCWPLFSMSPLSSWTFEKAVLIGDAAHPMFPFGGQGSNQAIEDGGVLGVVLVGVQDVTGLHQRLELFNKLRVRRASRVQILSNVRANNEHLVQDQIRQYMEPGVPLPRSFLDRLVHDSRFDALARCEEALRELKRAETLR
ncbi:hypothetical protein QQS21_010229 [Conoideocrella luteorostrata]|uniref:FAD-binding domain-containing protein n=1 Tax=Conoideocrella luteorostrata TaxID=1105319 RepID=A0AAJ0CHR2_9HYPO|nr:hypothetical protein QQS21_010229 [Conoideocrella luteorostrata]